VQRKRYYVTVEEVTHRIYEVEAESKANAAEFWTGGTLLSTQQPDWGKGETTVIHVEPVDGDE